jgi:hypothetical protein
MTKRKKKQPQQKKNNIEALMRDYARAILYRLQSAGMIPSDPQVPLAIKSASDEFLDGCVLELLDADVGAIIRLCRTKASSEPAQGTAGSNGGHNTKPEASQPPLPLLGYTEEDKRFSASEEDYYDSGIDF